MAHARKTVDIVVPCGTLELRKNTEGVKITYRCTGDPTLYYGIAVDLKKEKDISIVRPTTQWCDECGTDVLMRGWTGHPNTITIQKKEVVSIFEMQVDGAPVSIGDFELNTIYKIIKNRGHYNIKVIGYDTNEQREYKVIQCKVMTGESHGKSWRVTHKAIRPKRAHK